MTTNDHPPAPGLTASQTVGPFFERALLRDPLDMLVGADTSGERIVVEGRVLDGDGEPVPDALVEIWQANSYGRYHHPADGRDLPLDPLFTGFGRTGTDDDGRFRFDTIKPGPVPFVDGSPQAPHVCVVVHARGLLDHLSTRLYFADDPRNESDPILRRIPAERRRTLLAEPTVRDGQTVYRFDVVLQGEPGRETVFLNVLR